MALTTQSFISLCTSSLLVLVCSASMTCGPQQRGRGHRGHTQNGPLLQDHVLHLFKKDEESGINIYMLQYVKDINHKDLCIANGTLPNIL